MFLAGCWFNQSLIFIQIKSKWAFPKFWFVWIERLIDLIKTSQASIKRQSANQKTKSKQIKQSGISEIEWFDWFVYLALLAVLVTFNSAFINWLFWLLKIDSFHSLLHSILKWNQSNKTTNDCGMNYLSLRV